ncbi:MAG: bifunctional ornithine acetyltransferase/N-acetylglutamate synthase [Deltaproteobacteria bacterium]
MPSTELSFANRAAHRAWLETQSRLPAGFRVGTARLEFMPVEAPKPARMNLTLLAVDEPTPSFAAKFTRNAFPGAPVIVGRRQLAGPRLSAWVVNNKVSNVCAPGGVEAAEEVSAAAARLLGVAPATVFPSSTGVIGWRLPVKAMVEALPAAVEALQSESVMPAAEAILTTDLYPKVRRAAVGEGSIVGIAKGAGMIEPDLATMLVYILTDLAVPRDELRAALDEAVDGSFQCITVDSDTSTSDTVALVSSMRRPAPDPRAFREALARVARDLAEDVVRNGEGVHHVLHVVVRGAPDVRAAREIGKAVVNSPLVQCAVNGNDPNVGRLLAAIGKQAGHVGLPLDPAAVRLRLGGEAIFEGGAMRLDPERERRLHLHMKEAELYASVPPPDGLTFRPPIDFPPHERSVEIEIDLGLGSASAEVLGADRSHEYVTENADYRS